MNHSRRKFLKLSVSGAILLTMDRRLYYLNDRFHLPYSGNISLRFAVASDGHFGQPGTEYELLHARVIKFLNQEKQERGLDFTVVNGDIIHDDKTYFQPVKKNWDLLQMPYYVTHGNHDMIAENNWEEIWQTPWHYSFVQNEIAFIVLNSADDKGNYVCPDMVWTANELEKYRELSHIFIFMHITPLKWTGAALPCPELVTLFEKYSNIRAVFHGHDHDEDNAKEHNGKFYFFDSHIAGNWGTKYHGYRIIEVMKNGEILTYQENPEMGLTVNNHQLS